MLSSEKEAGRQIDRPRAVRKVIDSLTSSGDIVVDSIDMVTAA
jgi:hypothetical protein